MITRRGWAAIGDTLAALFVALTTLNPLLVLLALVAFAFVATQVVVFHRSVAALSPESFRVERSPLFKRMPVGLEMVVTVTVTYQGRRGFWGELYDVLPDSFDLREGSTRIRTWWPAGATHRLAYVFRPGIRGGFLLGPTVVSAHDPLGFARATVVLPTATPATILPPSLGVRPFPVGPTLPNRAPGRLILRRKGFGTEFRSLRPYQPDDDIRHIAWKRSTLQQLYVREFEQESRQDYLLLLDLDPSMHAGLWGESALDKSVEAATIVAQMIARQGEDRVGLLTYAGGTFQFLAPGRGPRQMKRLTDNLALTSARSAGFNLPAALTELANRLKVHTHIVAFSSLTGPMETLGAARVRFASRGHRLYLFVPDLASFYPEPSDPIGSVALPWAAEAERARRVAAIHAVEHVGFPVAVFGREGAAEKVLATYQRIRAWENSR
ncbi:MAG: DUF58 domain-containing protein [Thermoplasmata archaeon]|nr:DUF58 domain-containing protein [Thermoplasmata archaeon]